MAIYFLDSSAIVKRYLPETGTKLDRLFDASLLRESVACGADRTR